MNKQSLLNTIDKAVFIFTIIFLLSLTNSIFVNQIGYYGALILLIIRFGITAESPFRKSGLETAFLLIIISELLSALLSDNSGRAFFYMLKRVLVFPVVYTIIASASDSSKGKKYFYFYIGAALVTVLIYLFFSYRHYILNLYNIQQSGPSLFQYPITASEIMSFTVIILFAFLINEKTKVLYKLIIFSGFVLSSAALFSTYKRTGWIGTAAGILVILIIKRQWKILAAVIVLAAVVFFMEENVSRAGYFSVKESRILPVEEFETEGRAYNIYSEEDEYIISDFDDGIKVFKDRVLVSQVKTDAPVVEFQKWTGIYYIARLIDTRFLLLEKNNDKYIITDNFITPGFTTTAVSANNNFYVLDSDSGLSIFRNPGNLNQRLRLKEFSGFTKLFADEEFLIAASYDSLKIYNMLKGIPAGVNTTMEIPQGYNLAFYENGEGLLTGPDGTLLIKKDSAGISVTDKLTELSNITLVEKSGSRLFVIGSQGNIYGLDYPLGKKIKILFEDKLSFSPASISLNNNFLYYTFVKESRILSIFDLYNPSNFNRIAMWRVGWEIFKDYPIFGIGDIDMQEHYARYKREYDKEIMGHLHNNFVHILATLGLFGLIAVSFLMLKIIIINLKIFRSFKNRKFYESYALGVTGAFFSVIAAGLTEVNIWDQEILTLVLFTTGLNISFYYSIIREKL